MAGINRRQLDELRRLIGAESADGCPTCRTVYVIGMPGLFAIANRGERAPLYPGDGWGRVEQLSHDEAREFIDGCPDCGRDVPTVPIRMAGLESRPKLPDPYPLRLWPTPKPEMLWKAGNVYAPEREDGYVRRHPGGGDRR